MENCTICTPQRQTALNPLRVMAQKVSHFLASISIEGAEEMSKIK